MTDRFFTIHRPRPDADLRLICLPHAGGGASAYRHFPDRTPERIEVLPVQLPGRENRIREPALISLDELTDAVLRRADRPVALFGHSMGAWLAFELARRMETAGRGPVQVFASAAPSPPGKARPRRGLSDADLIERFAPSGAIPSEVLTNPDLRAVCLPALRADVRWADAYHVAPEEAITAPISVLFGNADPECTPERVREWSARTLGESRFHVFPGGHFFLRDRLDEVVRLIVDEITETSSGR